MANRSLVSFATFFALLLFFFIFTTSEVGMMVEANECERRSKTWSGPCFNTGGCDDQCKNWEGAKHGACHAQGWGTACFCYFDC
ncbi:hypothetical protein AQUCO_01000541v1 [Aquilegia coerulea]|uniref:Knottins-like domain-containing protein n=1 Tax=Aquilegia coerulea TaxID=218851 RepID=A0A2G5EAK6_AQUCA|nr:hypothetical protein AQUCO_01000541v1 [Aquilegia coerulea]